MKVNGNRLLILLLSLWNGLTLMGQITPGQLDNYSGSSATWLNPSNMRSTFIYMDFGFANVDVSFRNDFAYLPRSTLLPSLNSAIQRGVWPTLVGRQPDKDYYYQYFDPDFEKKKDVSIYESVDLSLPTFMLNFAGSHAIGFSLRQRVYTSFVKVPWEIPVVATESLKWEPMHHQRFTSEGMRFANMEWSEADLSYATTVYEDMSFKLDAGLTAKLMMGMMGFSGYFDKLDYEILKKDSLYSYEMDGDFNLVLPLDYSENIRTNANKALQITNPVYRGFGLGADIGFTLTNKRNSIISRRIKSACDDDPVKYFWRLGVSLIDVGEINFNTNTISGSFQCQEKGVGLKLLDTVQSFVALMQVKDTMMGNQVPGTYSFESTVKMGLPMALSMQFDANVYENFYVNATWIHPVSHLLYRDAVEREPLLSVTPRYENSFFGVAFPVTLYGYSSVGVGTFLRISVLEFGVNDILSLTGLGKTRGVDLYVALRIKLSRGDCIFHPLIDACGDKYFRRNKKRQK